MEAVLLLALWNFYSGTFLGGGTGTLIMYTSVGSKYQKSNRHEVEHQKDQADRRPSLIRHFLC